MGNSSTLLDEIFSNYEFDDNTILAVKIVNIFYRIPDSEKKSLAINNLLLQKLIYFTYGLFYHYNKDCKIVEKPRFFSWRLGPVNQEIYYQVRDMYNGNGFANIKYDDYKKFIENNLNNKDNLDLNKLDEFDNEIYKILSFLLKFSVFELVEKSHRTDPWINTKQSELIKEEDLDKFFGPFSFEKFEEL